MVYWVYTLDEYKQQTYSYKKKNKNVLHYLYIIVILSYQKNFQGTQKQIRISHGKRAISVWVI